MFHAIDQKISKEYKKQKRKKGEQNETIKELEKLVKYIPIAAKGIFSLTHHRRWLAILQLKKERAKDATHQAKIEARLKNEKSETRKLLEIMLDEKKQMNALINDACSFKLNAAGKSDLKHISSIYKMTFFKQVVARMQQRNVAKILKDHLLARKTYVELMA